MGTAEPRERKTRESKDADVTREPKGRKGGRKSRKDEDATTEAPEDDLELRRNLRKGKRRGGRGESDSDSTKEPKDSTSERRERKSRDDSKRESKDVTREPCDDCKDRRKRKDRGDSSDDSSDDSATTVIPLRRLLREETERTVDATKEPCDNTQEPRGRKGRKGGRKGRKSRKGEDVTTEAPEEVPALRRALKRDGGRKRRKGIDATISNGLVEIAGVTGEVVFGDVDEALETIPLTLTI